MAKAKGKQDRDGLFRRANSRFFWMSYVDENGDEVQRSTKETDRKQAVQVRAEAIRRVSLIRQGLLDPAAEKRRAKQAEPLGPKIEECLRAMAADGMAPRRIPERRQQLTAIVAGAGWSTLRDIEPKSLAAFLVDLRARPGRQTGYRMSDCTVRRYVSAIRIFVRWLVSEGCLQANPLAGLRLPSARVRHRRRMLLPDEYIPLADATLGGPPRCCLTGAERLLLYRTAIMTGFRASELGALTIGSLRRIAGGSVLALDGTHTKNGKDARIDIPADLAHDLRESFRAANPPRESLLRMPRNLERMSDMLRADLAAARQAWIASSAGAAERAERERSDFLLPVNAAGEKLVLHGLRHTSGAWQVLAGVPINVVKERMRHSAIAMTMDVYGHLAPGQERAACDTLAASVPAVGAVSKMSGTGRRNGPNVAENRPENAEAATPTGNEKGLELQRFPLISDGSAVVDEMHRQSTRGGMKSTKNALETGAPAGAVSNMSGSPPADPQLDRLVELWPDLPEAVRSALLATAEAAVATRPAVTTSN